MRVIIAVQVRLESSRLPNKALADLGGMPLIERLVKRLRTVRGVDGVVLACPERDAGILGAAAGVRPIIGPEEDVLTRILNVARETEADKIVKVGADCPLVPPDLIELALEGSKGQGLVQNTVPRTFPDGFDFEVWDTELIEDLDKFLDGRDREWFTAWALEHCESQFISLKEDASRFRLTLDYPEDLDVIRSVYEDMGDEEWDSSRLIEWCQRNPSVMKLNQMHVKDFGARPK